MRVLKLTPLVAATLLAGCGSGDTDADGDGALSDAEIAAAAEGMVQPRPGQYSSSLELLEFDVPGMPDAARQQMEGIFASGLAEGNAFCITEEDVARNGPEEMVKNMAESDCTMRSFNITGNRIVADMQCPDEGGGTSQVKMDGEMTAESSTMTMDMQRDVPNIGQASMKMRVTSQRTGDCA